MSEEEERSDIRQQHNLDDRYEGDEEDDCELRKLTMPHDFPHNGAALGYGRESRQLVK